MIDLSDVVRQLYVATKPLLLSGGGVQMTADVLDEVQRKSELLGAPVANTYLQDCLLADDAMAVAPLGCEGHEEAMKCVHEVDCIVVGPRMNPFGTLPQLTMQITL